MGQFVLLTHILNNFVGFNTFLSNVWWTMIDSGGLSPRFPSNFIYALGCIELGQLTNTVRYSSRKICLPISFVVVFMFFYFFYRFSVDFPLIVLYYYYHIVLTYLLLYRFTYNFSMVHWPKAQKAGPG